MNSTMTLALRRNRLIVGFAAMFVALFFLARTLYTYLTYAYIQELSGEYIIDIFLFVIFSAISSVFLASGFATISVKVEQETESAEN